MPLEFEEKLQEELCVRPRDCFAISGQSVNRLLGGVCFAPIFWGGKLHSFFLAGIALSSPPLYLLPVHPRRGSASLILTNKGKASSCQQSYNPAQGISSCWERHGDVQIPWHGEHPP